MTTTTTQVLRCNPSSISFAASDVPGIADKQTLCALKLAAHHLTELRNVVVFPTETVYGLGANALDPEAVSRIFTTKGRPADNPLIVHVSSMSMLHSLFPPTYVLSPTYGKLIKHFWPGALTLIFPVDPSVVPSIVTANHRTVAVRMPSHPVARALIAIANVPLAAPSANSSGKPSPTRAEHVIRDLGDKVAVVLDDGCACDVGLESTVVDGLYEDGNIRVLRPGGVTVEDIERVLREDIEDGCHVPKVLVHRRDFRDEIIELAPTTPGMKYRHYSPSVPVILLLTLSQPTPPASALSFSDFLETINKRHIDRPLKIGLLLPSDSPILSYAKEHSTQYKWCPYALGPNSNPSVTASRLFDGLITLDQEGVDVILVEEISEEREGLAVMNRVRKAAGDTRYILSVRS